MSILPVGLKKTVATAGTRVQLTTTANTWVRSLTIRALAANTGKIYVGGAAVSSTAGLELSAGNELKVDGIEQSGNEEYLDLANFYIDSSVNGEGVTVFYVAGE